MLIGTLGWGYSSLGWGYSLNTFSADSQTALSLYPSLHCRNIKPYSYHFLQTDIFMKLISKQQKITAASGPNINKG